MTRRRGDRAEFLESLAGVLLVVMVGMKAAAVGARKGRTCQEDCMVASVRSAGEFG